MDGNSSIQHVALLCGGDSAEREVSLASGRQAAIALAMAGYEPVLIDPADFELDAIDWASFSACLVALHGGSGENGDVQQFLEQRGVPYTGSGPRASRLAMNKAAAKQQFRKCGVPTLPSVDFACGDPPQRELAALGSPLVIKPRGQGSSLGVAVANSISELDQALEIASRFDSALIAEPFVPGREFTVSLLGRDPLPMIEIVSPQPVFTYKAKYTSAGAQYRFDSKLLRGAERQLYDAAVGAADALNTAGLVRVDLMLDQHNRPWVLEVNTIPGLTSRSLAPRAATAAGIDMPALVDWMVRDAVHRSSPYLDPESELAKHWRLGGLDSRHASSQQRQNRGDSKTPALAITERDCL